MDTDSEGRWTSKRGIAHVQYDGSGRFRLTHQAVDARALLQHDLGQPQLLQYGKSGLLNHET